MKTNPVERFWESVDVRGPNECWLWQKAVMPNGYGRFKERSYVQVYAHRYAYELEHGAIPEGMTVDHLCNTRACVNQKHLDVCSNEENSRRGKSRRRLCKNRLHDMTLPGAWVEVRSNGTRTCRECQLANWRRATARKRARRA